MADRKFFVGGNWKMNGTADQTKQLINALTSASIDKSMVDVVVAPPTVYLQEAQRLINANVAISAQNVYCEGSGAYTGETSVLMLKDIGVSWTIIGHSERRDIFGESDELIGKKIAYALDQGISVIACIGESLEEREAEKTVHVLQQQLSAIKVKSLNNVVIAYEPKWAIGTGKVASAQQAQDAHVAVRKWVGENYGQDAANRVRIIYGGSINGKNCKELAAKPDVDGFLVGGASLKPEFLDIVNARK